MLEAGRSVLLRLLQLLSRRVVDATAVSGQSSMVLGQAAGQSLCRKFFYPLTSVDKSLRLTVDDSTARVGIATINGVRSGEG